MSNAITQDRSDRSMRTYCKIEDENEDEDESSGLTHDEFPVLPKYAPQCG